MQNLNYLQIHYIIALLGLEMGTPLLGLAKSKYYTCLLYQLTYYTKVNNEKKHAGLNIFAVVVKW